ncbi:hypothetical protein GYH30_049655 [Glycine max]|nr:hypothetical protein GYH30_049655 [Glycine max]
MADDELSSECLDRLEAAIANLATAQLHSIVTFDSIVSKLDTILLKLHIPIPSSSSINSHHAGEEVPSNAWRNLSLWVRRSCHHRCPSADNTQCGASGVVVVTTRIGARVLIHAAPSGDKTRGGTSGFVGGVSHCPPTLPPRPLQHSSLRQRHLAHRCR